MQEIEQEHAMKESVLRADVTARLESGKVLMEILERTTLDFRLRRIDRDGEMWVRTYAVYVRDLNVTELVGHIVDDYLTNGNPARLITLTLEKGPQSVLMKTTAPIQDLIEALDTMCGLPEGEHISSMVTK